MSKPPKPTRMELDALSVELRKIQDELTEAHQALAQAKNDAAAFILAAEYAVQRRIGAAQKIGKLEHQLQKLRGQL